MPFESLAQLRRNREMIRAWVDRLRQADPTADNPETEAASWYRSLTEDQRFKLETDVDRLWSEVDELEGLASGPVGELLARFPALFCLHPINDDLDLQDFLAPDQGDQGSVDVARAFREMEQADPFWSVDWSDFLESLDEPDDRED